MKTCIPTRGSSTAIAGFLEELKNPTPQPSIGAGRLIIGLDATASRELTWDAACRIQGEMFEATGGIGGLEIQLVYYRGFSECKASRWLTTAAQLHCAMRSVACVGGATQIARVLDHAIRETRARKVNAIAFAGDAFEEKIDQICAAAGELGQLGTPVFCFHEGREPTAAAAFKQIASLSGGAYLPFDLTSAERLKVLLGAVAAYAVGGVAALEAYGRGRNKGGEVLRLSYQLQGTHHL
jgi:hypothetical protein